MPTAGKGTYRELLRQGEHLLRRRVHPAPCDDAATDAFLLLEKVSGLNRTNYPLKKVSTIRRPNGRNTLRCCGGGPPGSRCSISWGNGTLWGGTLR